MEERRGLLAAEMTGKVVVELLVVSVGGIARSLDPKMRGERFIGRHFNAVTVR